MQKKLYDLVWKHVEMQAESANELHHQLAKLQACSPNLVLKKANSFKPRKLSTPKTIARSERSSKLKTQVPNSSSKSPIPIPSTPKITASTTNLSPPLPIHLPTPHSTITPLVLSQKKGEKTNRKRKRKKKETKKGERKENTNPKPPAPTNIVSIDEYPH
jgi:hypothetical protein